MAPSPVRPRSLESRLGDFNDELRAHGAEALRQHLAEQIDLEDQHRLTIWTCHGFVPVF